MSTSTFENRPIVKERERYVPNHDVERFIVPQLSKNIDAKLTEHASEGVGKTVLDVGCGGQPLRSYFESRGFRYVGMDVNAAPDGSIEIVGPIDEDDLPSGLAGKSFDFIVCTEVLEHVAEWKAAWCNLERLLRPGGKMLVTCPHFYIPHEEPYDFWRPTSHAVAYHARNVGLTVLSNERAGAGHDVLGTLLTTFSFLPRTRRLWDRILCRLVRKAHGYLTRRMIDGSVRARLEIGSNIYQSSIAIIQKPIEGQASA